MESFALSVGIDSEWMGLVGKIVSSVKFFVPYEFEGRAMKLIRTAACNNIYLAAAARTGFCREK